MYDVQWRTSFHCRKKKHQTREIVLYRVRFYGEILLPSARKSRYEDLKCSACKRQFEATFSQRPTIKLQSLHKHTPLKANASPQFHFDLSFFYSSCHCRRVLLLPNSYPLLQSRLLFTRSYAILTRFIVMVREQLIFLSVFVFFLCLPFFLAFLLLFLYWFLNLEYLYIQAVYNLTYDLKDAHLFICKTYKTYVLQNSHNNKIFTRGHVVHKFFFICVINIKYTPFKPPPNLWTPGISFCPPFAQVASLFNFFSTLGAY